MKITGFIIPSRLAAHGLMFTLTMLFLTGFAFVPLAMVPVCEAAPHAQQAQSTGSDEAASGLGLPKLKNSAIAPPKAPAGPVDITQSLREVQTLPQYAPVQPDPWQYFKNRSGLQAILDKIDDTYRKIEDKIKNFLKGALQNSGMDAPKIEGISNLIFGIVVAAVIALLLWLVFSRLRVRMSGAPKRAHPGLIPADDALVLHTAAYHQAMAERHLEKGEISEALRHIYLGTLCHLDEQALIRYQSERTNLEYLRELRRKNLTDDTLGAVQQIVRAFEWTYFGRHELAAEEAKACYGQLQSLQKG